jgi:hypothetical protein
MALEDCVPYQDSIKVAQPITNPKNAKAMVIMRMEKR